MKRRLILAVSVGFLTVVVAPQAEARLWGRLIGRVLATKLGHRQVARNVAAKKIFRKDVARDAMAKAKPLKKALVVRRYTSSRKARNALHYGLAPGSHMTAGVSRGHPLSAKTAKRRYGLAKAPKVRLTIRIPKGQPVRKTKVIGGQRGRGEITSTRVIPKQQIIRVDRVR